MENYSSMRLHIFDDYQDLKSMSRENRMYFLENVPGYMAEVGLMEDLSMLLTDLRFIEAKCSAGMTYEVLDDYETAFARSRVDNRESVHDHGFAETSSMEIMRQYHDFIRKHVQRLILYTGVLHTLVYHEGFHAAQLSAQELSQKGLWKEPWFHTKPAWMPQPSKAGSTAEAVEVITEHMFPQSCATDLATERQMAFFIRRIGEIGMIDLRRGRELPHNLLIGDSRPLSLSCSPDGQYLAITHENGVAELLALHYDQHGLFVSQSKAGEFSYRLPEFEAPVMEFCGQCLWHQSSTGSIGRVDLSQVKAPVSEVALPADLRDSELSGIASTGDRIFVSIRQGSDTQIIALDKDGVVPVERLAATDVACLCTCGPNCFVAGLTSRRLVVFNTTDEVVRVGETPLTEIPTCIALKGETLVWISEMGRVFTWKCASADSPRRVEGGERGEFVKAQRLGTAPDGTYTSVTLGAALSFSIVPSSAKRTAQLQQVFPAAGEDTYYAIEKREGRGIWLLDGVRSEEVSIEERSEYEYLFAQDGNHHLFGVRPDGRGILIDLRTHYIRRIASIPANITSVAGSDHEGFWLADGSGCIYFVDADGACQALAHPLPSVDVVGRCQIYCWAELLVWSGMCRFDLDTRPLLRFFRSEGGQRDALRRVGQRLFEVADGVFKTLAYDTTRDYLWLLFTGTADFEASMKFGTPLDFRDYAEYTRQIRGIDLNIITSQMAIDGSGLYILCKTGNLFRVDTRGLRVQATFAGSHPLTHMALRPQPDGSLFLVQGGTQILACRFEDGSMK